MKKILSIFLVFIMLSAVFITGCNNDTAKNTYYIDEANIVVDGVHLELSCSESGGNNINLRITLTATNTQTKDKIIKMENLKVVNEETKVEYDCSLSYFYGFGGVKLQYGIKEDFSLTATIPSSYKTNNYYLKFTILGKRCIVKLYETPDELRTEHTISFKLYNYPNYINLNETVKVKYNRTTGKYVWEDNDHKYYCDTWYSDEARTQGFNWNTKITEDITLYGFKKTNISTSRDSSGTYITGINHVPSDKILVIDNNNSNKVYISNYAIYNNSIKEIYLPKELTRIYYGNFTNMSSLTKIHFEGTEAQCNSIESSSTVPAGVSIIFNSTY